jgi:hypothetical protein
MQGGMEHTDLTTVFRQVDDDLIALEQRVCAGDALPLEDTVQRTLELVKALILAYLRHATKKLPPPGDADALECFKVLVKGDPTWNAIRDNCRELVYYRNCIQANRRDALPTVPEKMAVRTARHIYLYMKTRCIREGRAAE